MFWRRLLCSIKKIAPGLAITMLLASCSSDSRERFSARVSPDGKWIAENFMEGDSESAKGVILIRALSDRSDPTKIDLGEPAADFFLSWPDNSHLTIWKPEAAQKLPDPPHYGNIHIHYATYKIPKNDAQTYQSGKQKIEEKVDPNQVTSDFSSVNKDDGKALCVLTITAHPRSRFIDASVKIAAAPDCESACGRWTHFSVVRRAGSNLKSMLTSATVSDIPSYNRLPDDDTGSSLRGQFLGPNTTSLMTELEKPSIRLQYAFDFFDEVYEIEVPTKSIQTDLFNFNLCLASGHG